MASELVIACPTCAQKYRVRADRVGHHAQCKKCGQRFRIQTDERIDDDTVLGWVMEENNADQSILGGTSIFAAPVVDQTHRLRPTVDAWETEPPPAKPRVRLDRIDEIGAYFEFPAEQLAFRDIRCTFPLKCLHCQSELNLEVHLILWGDKLPRQDAFHRRELETKALGRLDQLLRQHQSRWFDQLEPLSVLPPPFCNPFPYFICHNCSSAGEVTAHVMKREGREDCQIAIANLDVAREFFRNNGGQNTSGYRKLVEAAARQRNDRWRRLAFPVRTRISVWFKPNEGERFLGYFADTDFARAETGSAGVVLTDRRLIYKKYSTTREFAVELGGRLRIQADRKRSVVRISQSGARDAMLNANTLAASHLAKALTRLKSPWHVAVETQKQNEAGK